MEEAGGAWASLGKGMILPSNLKDQINELKMIVRDMNLTHSKDITMMKNEIAELKGIISGMNMVKGSDEKEEYNVFAYVDPSEVGIVTEIVKPDMSDVRRVKGFEVTVENIPEEPSPVDVPVNWWDGLDEKGISFELANLVVEYVAKHGGVINNRIWKKVYPENLEVTKPMKINVKKILGSLDSISFMQIDKLRGLYYSSKREAGEVYEELTGKTLDA